MNDDKKNYYYYEEDSYEDEILTVNEENIISDTNQKLSASTDDMDTENLSLIERLKKIFKCKPTNYYINVWRISIDIFIGIAGGVMVNMFLIPILMRFFFDNRLLNSLSEEFVVFFIGMIMAIIAVALIVLFLKKGRTYISVGLSLILLLGLALLFFALMMMSGFGAHEVYEK